MSSSSYPEGTACCKNCLYWLSNAGEAYGECSAPYKKKQRDMMITAEAMTDAALMTSATFYCSLFEDK